MKLWITLTILASLVFATVFSALGVRISGALETVTQQVSR